MRLLVIEDNVLLVNSLKESLKEHFKLHASHTGEEGLREAKSGSYDLIMLDLDLPDKDGLDVCAQIRQAGIHAPILVLTGMHDPAQKVRLLDAGADDYVTKPFNAHELRARLQALLRRASVSSSLSDLVALDGVVIDLSRRMVTRNGQLIDLRRKEFDILEYLVRNRGRVLTRQMISEHVSETGKDNWSNVIDVHIKHIRDKIERPAGEQIIKTVHGIGYTIKS